MHRQQQLSPFPTWPIVLLWMGVGAVGGCLLGMLMFGTWRWRTFLGTMLEIFFWIGFLLFWQGLIAFGQRIIEVRRIHSLWIWIIGGPLSVSVGFGIAILLIDPSQFVSWQLIAIFLLLVVWCRNKFIRARGVWRSRVDT